MTVYADVLVMVNLFVNYALLLCSSLILKNRISNLRLLAGAAIGSAYGLVIFLPEIPIYFELPVRIAVSAAIVLTSFGFRNIRRFLRCFFNVPRRDFCFRRNHARYLGNGCTRRYDIQQRNGLF